MVMKLNHRYLVKLALATGLALFTAGLVRAQHGHLNVGAVEPVQGSLLFWANGSEFIETSGYVKTLEHAATGRYAGYYQGGITLTALPATAAHAGPDPDAPALGAYVHFRMACLEGPPQGSFQFWDSTGTTPAESLVPGETGTNLWVLSENEGLPGTDPYGHIHGRRFTATKPGLYRIGFTAYDLSDNGEGGGPIHAPSGELAVWFQAGVNIRDVEPDFAEGHVHVHFGAQAGYRWQVEFSLDLGSLADWRPAGNAVEGQDIFVELIHDLPPGTRRYYRVVGTPIIP